MIYMMHRMILNCCRDFWRYMNYSVFMSSVGFICNWGPIQLAQSVTLLMCIREAPGSNLGMVTDYQNCSVFWGLTPCKVKTKSSPYLIN
jgi:hypothetical protein